MPGATQRAPGGLATAALGYAESAGMSQGLSPTISLLSKKSPPRDSHRFKQLLVLRDYSPKFRPFSLGSRIGGKLCSARAGASVKAMPLFDKIDNST